MQGGIQVGFHSEVYNVFEVSQLFPFNSFNSGLFWISIGPQLPCPDGGKNGHFCSRPRNCNITTQSGMKGAFVPAFQAQHLRSTPRNQPGAPVQHWIGDCGQVNEIGLSAAMHLGYQLLPLGWVKSTFHRCPQMKDEAAEKEERGEVEADEIRMKSVISVLKDKYEELSSKGWSLGLQKKRI